MKRGNDRVGYLIRLVGDFLIMIFLHQVDRLRNKKRFQGLAVIPAYRVSSFTTESWITST